MVKISTIIITRDEENNIKDCLKSVKWTDEIIIVDTRSKDRTREIASAYTDKIITTDEERYGKKRNLGIEKASNDWILWLDADERITEELKSEILRYPLERGEGRDVQGYLIPRKSFFINKFIKHCGWYPDYSLRLFRKSSGIRFSEVRVHEKLSYQPSSVRNLKNPVIHYTDLTFEHYLDKLNNYTSLAAADMKEEGKSANVFDILFRPGITLFKMYFLQLGVLDGYMGLVLCTLSGVSVFTKYSKLYFMK